MAMNSSVAADGIKLIGPRLTLKKKEEKKLLHSRLVSYLSLKFDNLLLKFDQRTRYERKYGWRTQEPLLRLSICPGFLLSQASRWDIPEFSTPRKLEETDFFYVDGETRSCFNILNFYRVYPYYEWDTTQIRNQMVILNHCCSVAVRTHNKRTDDHLEFDELVSANMMPQGFVVYYFITFKAYIFQGQSSREYQTRALYWRSPETSPPPPFPATFREAPFIYEANCPEAIINIQSFTACHP